jgi:endonuclease/exonuclease/phosphatase family metal-dependent hydrolase
VAGDFNQALSRPFYYWSDAAERLLRDALAANGLCARTDDPFDPVRAISGGQAACIDHICISASLTQAQRGRAQARSPIIDGYALSDHPAVWLDLVDV